MSRPKHFWYGAIRSMIMNSRNIRKDDSLQAYIFKKAMDEAKRETLSLPNGDLRMKAVNEVLIKQTKTYEGVGLEIHYNWRTIQNWVTDYVNLVGKKSGW